MKTKEVLEARWKVITFTLLALLASVANIAVFQLGKNLPANGGITSPTIQELMRGSLVNAYNAFVWDRWFATNGPFILTLFAVILGSVLLGVLWQCWHLPLYLTAWGGGVGGLQICEAILANVGITIVITWVFNHARGSLLITILMHATLDAFAVTMATSLFSFVWLQKNEGLALLIGFGVVALLLVVVTRGRLGYQQASSPSDVMPSLNDV